MQQNSAPILTAICTDHLPTEFAMSRHTDVQRLLTDIETEMRRIGLWTNTPPSAQALSSTMPFMYDTLTFQEWLQFVFLPRTQGIIAQGGTLPANSSIHPLAEHEFTQQQLVALELLALIQEMDTVLSQP